jgi:predicted DNA-binding transcriptional regulator AlpA
MSATYSALKMEIQGYSDGSWPKMIDAKEVEKITGVAAETIFEYARSGICPHILVASKHIFFIRSHIIRWLKACPWAVPSSLSMVADRLIEVPEVSGIYFLIQEGEVIYVGQSHNVASRIIGHKNKTFDRAFVLPCPPSKMNETEAAFIGIFKPKLNMNQEETRFVHNHRDAFDNPSVVIGDILAKKPTEAAK